MIIEPGPRSIASFALQRHVADSVVTAADFRLYKACEFRQVTLFECENALIVGLKDTANGAHARQLALVTAEYKLSDRSQGPVLRVSPADGTAESYLWRSLATPIQTQSNADT